MPNTPKQDSQTIDEILEKYHEGILANGTEPPEWWERQGKIKKRWFKQALEAYCAERERLARTDEVDRAQGASDAVGVDIYEMDAYLAERLAELKQQSSKEASGDAEGV